MKTIDINCDMGESFGTYVLGYDEKAMPFVSSINVACGFHASDPDNMAKTVAAAKKNGIAVGAHPGYPDLVGFGRRSMALTTAEVKHAVMYQIGALDAFCREAGLTMQHVKAHGALYNTAEKDLSIGLAIAEAIQAVNPALYMLCLANSQMVTAAKQIGVPYVEEAFADRAYTKEGTLVPRKQAGSVIHELDQVVIRVVKMVKDHSVISIDGQEVPIQAQTICVHGDTPGAVDMVKAIRGALEREGIQLRPFGA
jgi:5-oxoprolinase (ATP-hydrolysing) subunit A